MVCHELTLLMFFVTVALTHEILYGNETDADYRRIRDQHLG